MFGKGTDIDSYRRVQFELNLFSVDGIKYRDWDGSFKRSGELSGRDWESRSKYRHVGSAKVI